MKKFNDFYNGQILLSKNSKDDLFKSIIFEYKKNFYGINKNIKILDRINKNKANFSYYGVIKDIDFCGRLIIETKEGIKILSEEEISYFNF